MLEDNQKMLEDSQRILEDSQRILEDNQRILEDNQRILEDNKKIIENNENRIMEIEAILNNINNNFYAFPIKENSNELIEELKFRVDDLEKKLSNTLSQTKEKETISFNNEKLIKEFENLVTENTRETMLISYEKNLLENQAKSLRSALRNATNEIDILNIVNPKQKISTLQS